MSFLSSQNSQGMPIGGSNSHNRTAGSSFKPMQGQANPYNTHISAPHASEPTFQSPLDQIRVYTSKLEDILETVSDPIKPYLPAFGRFLIVVTFMEDGIRIVSQWSDQLYYLQQYRHFPWGLSHLFLIFNVIAMMAGSFMVISRRRAEIAVLALFAVVVTQALGYGLLFDLNFFFRNLSVIGGLLMVLSDSLHRRNISFAGIPQISDVSSQQRTYFQLFGRILLIFLFIGFIIRGHAGGNGWGLLRISAVIVGGIACVMVAVGFKAKWSAVVLVAILSIVNIIVNNFWSVEGAHPHRDFLKYDFFQTLSIMGGLLLLVNMGAGGISLDHKKKVY